MSEFKGTKGKWKSTKRTFNNNESIIVSETQGVIINLNPAHFDTDEEMEANALLISKAPEMLEMLQDLRDGDYPFINGALWDSINKLIKEATEL